MSNLAKKNIGIITTELMWGGGIDFLLVLINSILRANKYRLTIIDQRDKANDKLIYLKKYIYRPIRRFLLQNSYKDNNLKLYLEERLKNLKSKNVKIVPYDGSYKDLKKVCYFHKVDLIFPIISAKIKKDFNIPWVSYIPDLQHLHIKKNFENTEIIIRNSEYNYLLKNSSACIVNSEYIKREIYKKFRDINAKVYSLPFAPIKSETVSTIFKQVQKKYELPDSYYVISNQFWIHKGHLTAFKAVEILKREYGREITLVCTGLNYDYRNPRYRDQIINYVKRHKLQSNILFVGHINKNDQISIMKHSKALIQPTEYEGGPGGGAVYSATSLGIPILLSDIEVNREVIYNRLTYFKNKSAVELARVIYELENGSKKSIEKRHRKTDSLLKIGKVLSKVFDNLIIN